MVTLMATSEIRESSGFMNLCRLRLKVYTGMGMGWQILTLENPMPVARVFASMAAFALLFLFYFLFDFKSLSHNKTTP